MSDRATHRFDMGSRVQTFGKDHSADFPAGSKAASHYATLAQTLTSLDTAKAGQPGGTATAKEVLLDALRLDLQNIARTARAIDAQQPGFADKFRSPDSPSQTALLTAADAIALELAQPGIPAKFIAYELPADFAPRLQGVHQSGLRPELDRGGAIENNAAFPGHFFSTTARHLCLWLLAKNKHPRKRRVRCLTGRWKNLNNPFSNN